MMKNIYVRETCLDIFEAPCLNGQPAKSHERHIEPKIFEGSNWNVSFYFTVLYNKSLNIPNIYLMVIELEQSMIPNI